MTAGVIKEHYIQKILHYYNRAFVKQQAEKYFNNITKNRKFKVMKDYSLDRTAFRAHTAQEAGNHSVYYKNKGGKERLEIAAYLNSIAFTP